MIGIVSHDLGNPLSIILLGASSLERADLDEKLQKYVSYSIDSTRRAQRLVDDLLDFTMARLGRGISVDRQPIDLHAVVARCVAELERAHPERILQHQAVGDGECMANAQRLFQLLPA
ncbi:MAG: sensor histidine kinase [Rhodanobacteraceae bacterium]